MGDSEIHLPAKRTKTIIREQLLERLESIMDGDGEKTSDRLKAIELEGREFGLFAENKKLQIDVNTIVKHFTNTQLASISQGGSGHEYDQLAIGPASGIDSEEDIIDIEPSDIDLKSGLRDSEVPVARSETNTDRPKS